MFQMPLTPFLLHLDLLAFLFRYSNFQLLHHFFQSPYFLLIGLFPVPEVVFLIAHLELQRIEGAFEFDDLELDVLQLVHIFEVLVVLQIYLMCKVLDSEIVFLFDLYLVASVYYLFEVSALLLDESLKVGLLGLFVLVLGYLLFEVALHQI